MNPWWLLGIVVVTAVSVGIGRWIHWARLSPRERWQRRYDSQMRRYFKSFK
jgi:hypothetical protein